MLRGVLERTAIVPMLVLALAVVLVRSVYCVRGHGGYSPGHVDSDG